MRRLCEIKPALHTRFIMLTHYDRTELIFEAFKAGANGYLSKDDCSPAKLYDAIHKVLHGGAAMTPAIALKIINYFRREPRPVKSDASPKTSVQLTSLTAKENEVLQLVSKNLLDKQIAAELGVSDPEITVGFYQENTRIFYTCNDCCGRGMSR